MNILAALGERARAILKALPEKKDDEENPPVPNPPPDPDALPPDPRIDGADASPKEGDLDEAGESQAAAAPPAPQPGDGGEGGEGDAAPEPDGDEESEDTDGDGDGRPVAKGFDEFGNRELGPDEMREMLKSYGITAPIDEDKVKDGGAEIESILSSILDGLDRQNAVIVALQKEVERLRSENVERDRTIAKAMDSMQDPRTALAAPPRALTKAIPEGERPTGAPTEAQFATGVFADVRAGKLTQAQAEAKVREFKATPR